MKYSREIISCSSLKIWHGSLINNSPILITINIHLHHSDSNEDGSIEFLNK